MHASGLWEEARASGGNLHRHRENMYCKLQTEKGPGRESNPQQINIKIKNSQTNMSTCILKGSGLANTKFYSPDMMFSLTAFLAQP